MMRIIYLKNHSFVFVTIIFVIVVLIGGCMNHNSYAAGNIIIVNEYKETKNMEHPSLTTENYPTRERKTIKSQQQQHKNTVNPSLSLSEYQKILDGLYKSYVTTIETRHGLRRHLNGKEEEEEEGIVYNKRHLVTTATTFEPIRITVNDNPLKSKINPNEDISSFQYNVIINTLTETIIPKVITTIQELLYVNRLIEPLNVRNRITNCFGTNLPIDPIENTDFYIIIDGLLQEESEECINYPNIYAMSYTCSFDLFPLNPRAGKISICLDRINFDTNGYINDEEIERIVTLQLGEMINVLGASSDLFWAYNDVESGEPVGYQLATKDCIDNNSISQSRVIPNNVQENSYGYDEHLFYEITTPIVTQVVRNLFNCSSITGARLENQPIERPSTLGDFDSKCFGFGLDKRLFHDDILTSQVDAKTTKKKRLSPVSLALLEDSGWYKVDFSKAEPISFGLGAGCGFVNDDCLDWRTGTVTSSNRDFFCDSLEYTHCDATYHSIASCNMVLDEDWIAPLEYFYFPDTDTIGNIHQYDFCPIPVDNEIQCDDSTRCFQQVDGASLCLVATCNTINHQIDFVVDGKSYTCQTDFEEIVVDGLSKTIQCPRFASFCPEQFSCPSSCSGKGICDWMVTPPICDCFIDENTLGCYGDLTN